MSLSQLRGLDARDLCFWLRQAHVKQICDRLVRLEDMRVAYHADKDEFSNHIAGLKEKLHIIRFSVEEEQTFENAWDELISIEQGV